MFEKHRFEMRDDGGCVARGKRGEQKICGMHGSARRGQAGRAMSIHSLGSLI